MISEEKHGLLSQLLGSFLDSTDLLVDEACWSASKEGNTQPVTHASDEIA